MSQEQGIKHDQEKPRMELLSTMWLQGVAAVLSYGARKYAPNNWRKGIQISRLTGAALRHLTSFNDGESLDPETGLSHLYHASCMIMFAAELVVTHPELDDRYTVGAPLAPVAVLLPQRIESLVDGPAQEEPGPLLPPPGELRVSRWWIIPLILLLIITGSMIGVAFLLLR